MLKRLQNRASGSKPVSTEPSSLYAAYQAQLHDGISSPNECKGWKFPLISKNSICSTDGSRDIQLILLSSRFEANQSIDPSVEAALSFGRNSGWEIDWYQSGDTIDKLSKQYAGKKLFVMPIVSDAEYRIDVFHQMLSVVSDGTCLLYADHNHVDSTGAHVDPVLKPEWNPELLLNSDYIRLPWMIGGDWGQYLLREHANSKARYDQVLLSASLGNAKATTLVAATDSPVGDNGLPNNVRNILHIPALKSHQVTRIPEVLASLHLSTKKLSACSDSTADKWPQQVKQALSDAGQSVRLIASNTTGRHRILWPLPDDVPSVDIIIPSRDHVDVLRTCIESVIGKTCYPKFNIIVVDNDSQEAATESYYQTLENDSRLKLLRFKGAFNYSAINNFAVSHSDADVLVLLNNDTEVMTPHWLDEMIRQAMRKEVGCVGAKLYYSNGRVQHGGVILGITGIAGHAHRYSPRNASGYCGRLMMSQNLSAVTAACLAVRRSVWEQAGGLDEEHLRVAWNDVDFCLKVQQAGYRNLWTPHAELFHHEGLSRGADNTPEKIRRVDAERQTMLDRWTLDKVIDPAYHPRLTRDSESFSVCALATQTLG